MRLLFVHEWFGSLGGAEGNVFAVASELKRRGHAVEIAAQKRSGRGETEWDALFGKDAHFPASGGQWDALLETSKPDVIYMHKWEELQSIEKMIGSGVPVIRMVHDHDLYCLRSYKYNPLTRNICTRPASGYCVFPCLAPLKRNREGGFPIKLVSYGRKVREIGLNRKLRRLVAASEYIKHELVINGFDPAHIELLPPVPPVGPVGASNFGDRNLLLFAGQIVRGKGVDVLLQALARVRGRFEAVIAGDGSHRGHCEKLAVRLGLQTRVKFLGFVKPAEMSSYQREATAVLVSSVWPEPFGLVGLEAMRQGLPVVAFDAGGIRDWLQDGENGFLVPWMDVDGYAAAVDRLLADKELARRLGEAGRARAARDFDFGNYISKLESLLEAVASKV